MMIENIITPDELKLITCYRPYKQSKERYWTQH